MKPLRDWDDAFANMAYIPGSEKLPEIWAQDGAVYRENATRIEEVAYGDHPREKLDLVWPDSVPKGLAVFVHGGFWVYLDKSHWSHYAEGARANGWAVCLPSYTLAPEARISDMTRQISTALTKAATIVSGEIRLAGHSAGGHLTSRMVCADTPLSSDVSNRITHTLSISGLHDLRPLLNTKLNEALNLNLDEATTESAVLQRPNGRPRVTAWVGGGERPEFIRQSQILATMWEGLDADISCQIDMQHDHFSVLEGLRDPDSPITQAFVGELK
ncbi:alpha/beta hydrolase [Shimia sp.]|uniref:alpha/beta hydrolase n=1 Tax=Shimia sp. TaxID=1954381 RepID=UPI0032988D0C